MIIKEIITKEIDKLSENMIIELDDFFRFIETKIKRVTYKNLSKDV